MDRIRITMLTAGLGFTGTPVKIMDVIENINYEKFELSVAYMGDYPGCELDFLDDLKSLGIKLVKLRGKRLFNFRSAIDLYRHLKESKTQIIHCWDALEIVARVLKLGTGCRVIMSYCNPVVDKGSIIFYFVNKLTSLLTDGTVFCSQAILRSYQDSKVLFLSRCKKMIIHNCINISKIKQRSYDQSVNKRRYGIIKGDIVLTNIGFFNQQKGQVYLIRAVKDIVSRIPQVKLILVGWGPLEKKLKLEVRALNIDRNVIFAGKCQRNVVLEILSITDVFILSSLWEGFGRVIGEAMAMGKPVVSTKTDGSDIVIKQNETGVVVPPKDPYALANAVVDLLMDPERMQRIGELGKQRVIRLFSREKFIQKHEDFYRELLN